MSRSSAHLKKKRRPEIVRQARLSTGAEARATVEPLEQRFLFTWIGATTGATNDASHQYDNTANWSGGVIDDSFAGVNFTGNTTLYLAATRTTGASGMNFAYGGSFDLVIKSTSTTARTLNLSGDITGTFGGSNVTIGDATNPINIALGTATRTTTTASGKTLLLVNVISSGAGGGVAKQGAGTLTLAGANTYSGGTTLSAGQININNARAPGTGTLTINGGTIDNTSGASITLTNNNAQTWAGDFTFVGTGALNVGTGAVALASARTMTVSGGTFTEGGVISGGGSLTKAGAGTLTLSGTNTFSAGMTLLAGRLNINNAKAVGSGTFTLGGGSIDNTSGGALTLTNNNAQTWDADVTFVGSNALSFGTGVITLSANRTVSTTASTLTVGGVVGDGGNACKLTKSGAGILTLSGANTFSGGTTLSAGQLNINNASAVGTGTLEIDGGTIDNSSAAAITLSTNNAQSWGGDFTFVGTRSLNLGTGSVLLGGNRNVSVSASTLTIGGAVSDAGFSYSLTKSGAGVLALAAAGAYDGGTTINAGTLSFANNALGTGAITFSASSILQWATGNTQDISASLAAIGSGVVATIDTVANNVSFASALSGAGSIAKAGTGALTLSTANNHTGGTTLSAGTLNINDAGALGTGTFTINGGTINNSSAVNITISTNNAMVWGGNFAFTGTKNLDLGTGAVSLSAARTVTANANTLTVGGVIGGAFSLTKAGNGALTLTNANTYSGGTSLTAGTLNVNNASAIGSGSLTLAGGTINNTSGGAITLAGNNSVAITGNITFGNTNPLSLGTGAISTNGARTVTITTGTTTFAGVVGGAGSIIKAGAGSLVLSAANTYSGGTSLSAGVLAINNASAIGTGILTLSGGTIDNTSGGAITLATNNAQIWGGSFTVANTNALNLGTGNISTTGPRVVTVSTGNFIVGGAISGTGSVGKAGAGAMTMTAANTYSGGTTLTLGTLNINNAAAIGTGTLTLSAGTLDNTSGGAITLANNNAQTWGGSFTFGGTNDLNLGTGNVAVAAARTVTTSAGTLTFGGTISGAGSLVKAGAGTLALSGTNTYSAGTTLNAGELDINSASAIGSGTLTIAGGTIDNTSGGAITLSTNNAQSWAGNFTFDGTNDLTFGTGNITLTAARAVTTTAGTLALGGVIGGAFALTKSGAGTLIVTGSNTFSGGLTVSGGTYLANNAAGSGTGSGAVGVSSGATLGGTGRASGAVTITSGGHLSPGYGGTAVFNTGNLTLASGANLDLTLNGDTAGSGFDSVNVTGTVSITGSTLNLAGSRSDRNGAALAIITNDASDGVTGTFAGHAQGATVTFNGVDYTASYIGGTGNDVVLTADIPATSTALSSDANPAVSGQMVTYTATVTTAASGTPTGSVTLKDGATVLGTIPIDSSGVAIFSTATFAVGSHSITATYSGDSSFLTSTSSAVTQVINQAATSVALSPLSPAVFGESITFTATVSVTAPGGGVASGTVTFKDGTTVLGTGTLDSSGVATLPFASLAVGDHSITAIYNGDTDFVISTSSALTQTISQASTTSAVISSAGPSVVGQAVTFTATVTATAPGSGVPSGTVTFKDGSTVLGTGTLDSSGVATLDIASLALGNHSITAVYSGATDYVGSTSSTLAQTVNQASTTATLSSSVNPTVFGESTVFVATIAVTSPGAGTPTGTATLMDGVTVLATDTLDSSGHASFNVESLATGSHAITVVYSGDADFVGSTSSALTQVVNASATSTTVSSSITPSVFGQSVTFTAMVVATAPGDGVPTGDVTFKDGATVLGTATLDSVGLASLPLVGLAPGTHSITAVYASDSNFTTSTSSALTQTVNQAATTTSLAASTQPTVFGQSVTFTATVEVVSPGDGAPSGTVTFKDGATVLGTGTLDSAGVATFTLDSLAVGDHSITAIYAGDTDFTTSTSSALTQTVNQAATAATIAPLSPSVFGELVTFTATIAATAPGAGTLTGTVTFKDGATVLGTGTLDSAGVATLTTDALNVASHSITAVYSGDTSFSASTSAASTQVVNKAATTTAISASTNASVAGEPITFTATIATTAPGNGTATGTVTFRDGATVLGTAILDSSGAADFTVDSLSVGHHAITATYDGDTSFATSTSSASTQTIDQATTTTTIDTTDSAAVFGQSISLIAHVAINTPGGGVPTGTITFRDGSTILDVVALDSSGDATLDVATLAVGSHSITADYSGDDSFVGSTSSTLTQSVDIAGTNLSVASSSATSVFGESVTITATLGIAAPGRGVATGTITFYEGSTVLGTGTLDGNGHASLTIADFAVGDHAITATYDGDANFDTSASTSFTQHVARSATSATIGSSSLATVTGEAITFTAILVASAPGAGTPGGSVAFWDGSTLLGSATLDGSGQATFTTAGLDVGLHSISVVYAGDTNFAGSTSALITQGVARSRTTTTLTSSGTTVFGQSLTLTASVLATTPGTGVPMGTVTFMDGTVVLGTVALDGAGVASLNIATLGVGDHAITAVYDGVTEYLSSSSDATTQTIDRAPTTVSLTTDATSDLGAAISLVATISIDTPGAGVPTGFVTFMDGTTVLGAASLDPSGIATIHLSGLLAGDHVITAIYPGDNSFAPATSAAGTLAVNKANSAATVALSASKLTVGDAITITATITDAVFATPGGVVTFMVGSTVLGTATLDDAGHATFTTSSLAAGTYSIRVVYGGDANFLSSVSASASLVVRAMDVVVDPPVVTPSFDADIAGVALVEKQRVRSVAQSVLEPEADHSDALVIRPVRQPPKVDTSTTAHTSKSGNDPFARRSVLIGFTFERDVAKGDEEPSDAKLAGKVKAGTDPHAAKEKTEGAPDEQAAPTQEATPPVKVPGGEKPVAPAKPQAAPPPETTADATAPADQRGATKRLGGVGAAAIVVLFTQVASALFGGIAESTPVLRKFRKPRRVGPNGRKVVAKRKRIDVSDAR